MSLEEIVRLECLKIAIGEDVIDTSSPVDRARAYAEFVLDQKSERDA